MCYFMWNFRKHLINMLVWKNIDTDARTASCDNREMGLEPIKIALEKFINRANEIRVSTET